MTRGDAPGAGPPLPSLDALWDRAPPAPVDGFDPARLAGVPARARSWLARAIPPGARLATAVRLRMRGEIRLKRWLPFRAEQVLVPTVGMRWQARVGRWPMRVSGYDTVVEGRGAMQWRMLGLLPVMRARGPDIDRASIARLQAELVWLPTALLPAAQARWATDETDRPVVALSHFGWTTNLHLEVGAHGRLEGIDLERWGELPAGGHALRPYGAVMEEERTFGGITIPSRLRVGWGHVGTAAFEESEYFRAHVEDAVFHA